MRKTWPEDMWTEDGSIRGAMGMSRRGRTLRTIETYKSDREQLSEAFWASILFSPIPGSSLSAPDIIVLRDPPINGSVDGTDQFKPPSRHSVTVLCGCTSYILSFSYPQTGDSILHAPGGGASSR